MATLVRDVERPAFLDQPDDEQLTFGAGAPPRARASEHSWREKQPERESLSERLQAERAAATVEGAASARDRTPQNGGATLDELLVGAWEGLSAHRSVACPVCTAQMAPRVGAAGGACGDCGSQLR